MDGETPIRPVAGPGKIMPPGFRKSLRRRASPAVDAWDCRARLDDDHTMTSNDRGTDREERLLHFVDILRTEQVRASIVANTEGGGTGFRRWRGRGLLLAVAIIAMGGAAAFLHASRPPRGHPDAKPHSALGMASVQPAPESAHLRQPALPPKIAQPQPPGGVAEVDIPAGRPANPASIRPTPEALSLSSPDPSEPVRAERQVTDPPEIAEAATLPAAVTTQPKSIDFPAPRQEADASASPAPTRAAAEVPESEAAKPVLRVYYPHGSSRAEANARSLSARINSKLTSSDFEAQTNLPSDAVIKFSEERNHPLARVIGKSLGDSGYRWKIESTSSSVGSHRNMIEVWLPR
jgi:hypothetical protein